MMPFAVKTPTIPIPFQRLLRIVAVVDRDNPQIKELLDQIRSQGYEIEVTGRYERDVSEDAGVGAYIALVDGAHLDSARNLARGVRAIGFRTPLWALADMRIGKRRLGTHNGLLKTYDRPFSRTDHEALTAKDLVWIKWKDGRLMPYSDAVIAGFTAADFRK